MKDRALHNHFAHTRRCANLGRSQDAPETLRQRRHLSASSCVCYCQCRQAGFFLKEISAIVRATCRGGSSHQWSRKATTLGCLDPPSNRGRGYFAPEPASRTRPRRTWSIISNPSLPREGCRWVDPTLEEEDVVSSRLGWSRLSETAVHSSPCFQSLGSI